MGTLRAAVILYSDAELVCHLLGLSLSGYECLREASLRGRPYPLLYQSGVKYTREPPGSEVWQIPRGSYASRQADCEDLAGGWRTPELWLLGETLARPVVKRVSSSLRHILVRRADGSIEDPSLILGMNGAEKAARARATILPVIACSAPIPFFDDQLGHR